MAENRAYIRGCGVVSAVGSTQHELASACYQTTPAPDFITLPHSSDQPLPFYSITDEVDATSSIHLYQYIDNAVDTCIQDAALTAKEILNLPVFVGSTAGDISDLETHYQQALRDDNHANPLYRSGFGVLAAYVVDKLNSCGQTFTFNTACSASANALLMAARMIEHGRIKNALVLGVETRNQMTLQGFNSLLLISPQGSQPFDKHRNGTVLGEGTGAIILSRDRPANSDYAAQQPYYLAGGANLTDSINITSSDSEMIAAVMQQALENTAIDRDRIDIIKAHGTSTIANDSAEAEAMRRIFTSEPPPFTSLKPYIGHTLGACGVMETILMLACLKENFIPRTPGFSTPDETCAAQPMTRALQFSGGNIMLNYFGFGGSNTSLVISNHA